MSYVNAGQMTFDSSDDPTREEIEILIGALRPATAAQWLSFIQGASNRDGGLSADSLADYAGGRAGTVPPPKQLGDPGDLDLTVTAETKLATWEDTIVVLHVANPTGHPINDPSCALDRAEAALVPKGESDPPQPEGATIKDPWWHVSPACDGGIRLDPGATKDIRVAVQANYRDPRYGPLPGGDYRVVVRIDDRRTESPPVAVGAIPCGANGAGFEPSYVGLSLAAAKQRAKADGASVRDVTTAPDGIGNESTACDRINVIIDYGKVAFARRY